MSSILHRRAFLARHNEKQKSEGEANEGQNSEGSVQEGQQGGESSGAQGSQSGEGGKKTPVAPQDWNFNPFGL